MKRILISLGSISAVVAIAIGAAGATGAFFSDTETSTGNIFTAGSIDLKIDHSLSSYNGNNVVNDLVVVSDPTSTFVENDTFGAAIGNAVNLSFVHPAWETISGANWIWATQGPNHPADPLNNEAYIFTKTFVWNGPVTSASIDFGADNYYDVSINGNPIGSDHNLIVGNFQLPHTTNVTAFIVQGVNTITFRGENQHVDGTDGSSNPAGIIFRLDVHGSQLFVDPIDLPGTPFWNFPDVKPQDEGRDVFSLHVGTNDAWTCLVINNVKNNENTLIEPEATAGDVTPGVPPGTNGGELGNYLNLFLWRDLNGDGIYNPPGETTLSQGLFGSGISLAIHDSTTGNGALVASTTEQIGAAWCAGTQTVDGLGVITCNGAAMGNDSQTDSLIADLTFYATQQRNQPNFTCSSVVLPPVSP